MSTGPSDHANGPGRRLQAAGARVGTTAGVVASVAIFEWRGIRAVVLGTALCLVAQPRFLAAWLMQAIDVLTQAAEVPPKITHLIDVVRKERPKWRRRPP